MRDRWSIDENTVTTLITDSQSVLQSLNTMNPNYAVTAQLQWELARQPGKVKCRWIPAHCGCGKQDEVDERAQEAAKENSLSVARVMKLWSRNKKLALVENMVLEFHVAKRILRRTLMDAQIKEWRTMKTKMAEMMALSKKEVPPKAAMFQHPVAKIAARVNRMRTQKTRFQRRRWRKTFCKQECVEELDFQCDRCKLCGNGGRWTFQWDKCVCEDEKGSAVDRDIEHMLTQCTATDGIVRARNKLWNFHVRSSGRNVRVDDVLRLADADDGSVREEGMGEVAWQRMLIPIGKGHMGSKWGEKNNELIYEVRWEHIKAERERRRSEARRPPSGSPSGVPSPSPPSAPPPRRSARVRSVVGKPFFVS